jgi:beta-glucosidase
MDQIHYKEGQLIDYHHFDAYSILPRFEFGFGLSYDFEVSYSALRIRPLSPVKSPQQTALGTPNNPTNVDGTTFMTGSETLYSITCTIQNVGTRSGKEISQLYLSPSPGINTPPQMLRGFIATELEPGEERTIEFTLTRRDCRYDSMTECIMAVL